MHAEREVLLVGLTERRGGSGGRRGRAAAAPRPHDDGAAASCLPEEQWPQETLGGVEAGWRVTAGEKRQAAGSDARRGEGREQGKRTTNERSAYFWPLQYRKFASLLMM